MRAMRFSFLAPPHSQARFDSLVLYLLETGVGAFYGILGRGSHYPITAS